MRNSRELLFVFFFLFTLLGSARFCQAVPTQFGDSGLVSQPTAETLNSGNICVGIIGNCAANDGKTATVLPVFMTLGLGSFLEAYGSYPNVLFNGNEEESGRGYSNVGFKIRVFGKRSAQFKLGIDGQLRRTVSNNINYDGLTDQIYRAIASYHNGTIGLHGNFGYINPESPQYISYEKQLVYGGGLEFLPNSRLRLLTEIGIETSKSQGLSDRAEVTAGFQYFLSPHLTLNLALAKGFSDESPDWRALFGFSSCQGIGTYQRPIPRKVAPPAEQPEEAKVEVKALKVRTLTPLSPKKKVVEPIKSSSKYAVPVGEQAEEVTLSPVSPAPEGSDVSRAGGAVLSAVTAAVAPMAISSGIPLLQVAPEIAGSVAASALTLPVNDALALSAPRASRSYKLNDVVKTDDSQVVGKKIVEDLRYRAKFYSITETPTTFSATFIHMYDKPLDVWIEGAGKAGTKLLQSKAAAYEEITLTIDKVNGKVPYFKLHIGELSEVFEFFPLRKSVKIGKIEINIKPVNGAQGMDPQVSIAGQGAEVVPPVDSSAVSITPTTAVAASALEVSGSGDPGAVAATARSVDTGSGVAVTASSAMGADSSRVVQGIKASAPESATTTSSVGPSAAPSASRAFPPASVSAAPVVGGAVAGLPTLSAPEVGVVVMTTSGAIPSAGVTVDSVVTATAPSAVNVAKRGIESAPGTTPTISSTSKSAAPSALSSLPTALVSAAPAIGGAMPFPEVVLSPHAGNVDTVEKVSGPRAGDLTGAVAPKAVPEAGSIKVGPELLTTPGGSTVILLNAGAPPVPGKVVPVETMTVSRPVSGPLAAFPAKAVQAVAYKKFRLPSTVVFAFDDATLTEEGKAAITDVVEEIKTEKRWFVLRVDGFTDSLGSDDYNVKLGLRRAISVASYMVTNNGVDPTIIFVKSSGENDPIATNETDEGRILNRRAEIVLFVQKEE